MKIEDVDKAVWIKSRIQNHERVMGMVESEFGPEDVKATVYVHSEGRSMPFSIPVQTLKDSIRAELGELRQQLEEL